MKLVECVPNFSEGVRKEVVDEIAKSIASCGVEIFDVEMNSVHNRSVITFVGSIDKVFEAAFQGAKTAVKLIDLNKHKGEHPRMGACDVVPVIPINTSIEDCKKLAERIGERIAKELEVPVYFYEENARIPERKKLEKIRKGGFEWLRENVEQRMPDIGEKMHPTAGATVVGARKPLVAYNVYLNRKDEQMGKSIAKAIRESGGEARAELLQELGVSSLICGAISNHTARIVERCGIELMPWFVGEIDDVIDAYCTGSLDSDGFIMPGCGHGQGSGRGNRQGRRNNCRGRRNRE